MEFDVPEDLRFLDSHEWVDATSEPARVGISDFAQDELGDIVYVELPDVGDHVDRDDSFGIVESIKAVSDLYAPVSGEVVAVNEAVFDEPELVNDDPYDDGWLLELELDDEGELDELLSADEYADQVE